MDFEKVIHSFDMADYNRSVEDNFRFLGVVGSLASIARNSDLVRVETSGYSCAAYGQISHTSSCLGGSSRLNSGRTFVWMDADIYGPCFRFICLALIGKYSENSWWVFGRNWFNVFTGIGVVCRRRRGTLIKWQLKQQVIIFFFEQRSFTFLITFVVLIVTSRKTDFLSSRTS